MYYVACYFNVHPERRGEFIAAALEDRRDSLAHEPGTMRFELIEDADQKRFYLNEAYADKAAFERHENGPHYRRFFQSIEGLVDGPFDLIRGVQVESATHQRYVVDSERAHEPSGDEGSHFLGRVAIERLGDSALSAGLEVLVAFFDVGARTRPHIHPTEQVLYFISGTGLVAFPDQEDQEIAEGEVFIVPGGTLHMHGATKRGPMSHLSVRAAGATDWDPILPLHWRSWGR